MIKIGNIELSQDSYWEDEFDYNKFESNAKLALDGSLVVQTFTNKTRPMTLKTTWVKKPTVDALFAMYESFNGTMFTVIYEDRTFNAIFRTWEENPIQVEPILDRPVFDDEDIFDVTISLQLVNVASDYSYLMAYG